ncbi:hypothetical protein NW761_007340 [Fusarium oxysporum]|nr:hypothetical protein NW763_009945 [Fusarium oxysporum]KAJ4047605.1 hypothetical protein NW758_005956 [Fusarium oxysporum]KAJ4047631.1 hypothetical protein NW753_008581 [Fusarium oxysporum]KAJ4089031.1 hypothetical protein NW761_007340 [Fusarium oxysporum]KAJ4093584.1 hypothetical protein NW756_005496 [Fusarium oxysporum]
MQEFHCTENETSQLGTYVLLTLGLSNLMALPSTFLIGKRYTIIVSVTVFLATNIWSGEAQSYQSLRSARILGGLAGGLIEALTPTILAETFPGHHLAKAMVVYVGFLAVGAALGPIISGAIAKCLGDWRWFNRREYVRRSFSLHFVELNWKAFLISFFQPLKLIVLPQVLVTVIVFGLTIGWTVIASILISLIYTQPPLIWDPLSIGLLNTGSLVGIIIGLPIGGALADMLFNRATRRSNGVTSPVTRLPALLPGALLSPAGCIVMGFALRDPDNYIVVCVGWGMLCFGLTGSANVLLTYAIDCLPTRAAHIGALANVTKNSIGFAVSYGTVDWFRKMGPVGQFSTMAGILWGSYLLVIPLWVLRRMLERFGARFE